MIKKLITLVFVGIICFELGISANAQYIKGTQEYKVTSQSSLTSTRAVVIVRKLRYFNGRYQSRRWNETFGYWVDPYWIDIK